MDDFYKRMDNWRRTVRGSLGGGASGFCASWAKLYVAGRLANENASLAVRERDEGAPRPVVSVNELDGWLVEAAVRSLTDFDERKVLQLWYVWEYPEHWIKTKLLLRRTGVTILRGRAENNLRKVFTQLENAASILTYNLHAGNVPRPETKVALDGANSSLGKEKALID